MKVNTDILIGNLNLLIKVFDNAHVPLMVYGPHGIGKSEIVQQTVEQKAKELNRQFVYWDKLTQQQKKDAIANPTKYCVLVDARLASFAPEDIKGIPNIFNKQDENSFLETVPYSWVIYITRPGAAGTLFFDELNLAMPSITAAAYQAINDRVIGDRPISEGINIVAAGNREEDSPNVYSMVPPLRDRLAEVNVMVDHQSWLTYSAGKILNIIHSFCSYKTQYIYQIYKNGEDKDVTPRGIFRLSRSLESLYNYRKLLGVAKSSIENDMKIDTKIYDMVIRSCVGFGFAAEFKGYIKCYNSINWDVLFNNPTKLKDLTVDEKYAVLGGICDKLNIHCKQNIDNEETFNLINLMFNFEDEFFFLCIKQLFLYPDMKQWLKKFIFTTTNSKYLEISKKFKTYYASKIL